MTTTATGSPRCSRRSTWPTARSSPSCFAPTGSSWLNQVERWFAELTTKKLRRSTHHTVRQLRNDITAWTEHWNADPRPYRWHKTADEILDNLAAYCKRINQLSNDSGH